MRTVDVAGLGVGADRPVRVMGVVTVGTEAGTDPSAFDRADAAAEYVEDLVAEGADLVEVRLGDGDIGHSVSEERDYLATALDALESVSADVRAVVATRHHAVADAALGAGVAGVTDVAGFADPEMPAVCREYDAPVVKVASGPNVERPDAVDETPWAERRSAAWADRADHVDRVYEALGQGGFTERTVVDPGLPGPTRPPVGTVEDDLATFRRLREFSGLGRPVAVTVDRQPFLRSLPDRSAEEGLPVTLAAAGLAVERGADLLRTHDVRAVGDAATLGSALAPDLLAHGDGVELEELDARTTTEVARHVDRVGGTPGLESGCVVRVFELRGVPADARGTVMDGAVETGVLFIEGEESAVVSGTVAELDRFGEYLEDEDTLVPTARALRGAL